VHIPDGYLSPQTCAVMYAACIPFWITAGRKLKHKLAARFIPLLSIFSAFSFVIMMFNIPVPGGTTAHAIGSVLMAVLLGPWAAVMGVSAALLIQALFFGDGGILSFAANAFNMAVIMPFTGYYTWKLLNSIGTGRAINAALAGYVGINAAALFAAVELGIQPVLFHAANGAPLYCPYGLSQAIPAMMFAHISVGGLAEAFVTGGVLLFLKRSMPEIMVDLRTEAAA